MRNMIVSLEPIRPLTHLKMTVHVEPVLKILLPPSFLALQYNTQFVLIILHDQALQQSVISLGHLNMEGIIKLAG